MATIDSATHLRTANEIASEIGQPSHKVLYVIKSRRIEPTRRAGNARLYCDEKAALIIRAVKGIAEAKAAH